MMFSYPTTIKGGFCMAKLHVTPDSIKLECTDGKIIELNHFQEVGPLCWGYFWYRLHDKYGYMDEEGSIICEPIYLSAGNFDITLHAPVESSTGKGFINRSGTETCRLIYEEVWWYNNGYAKVMRDGNIYYLDRIGCEQQLPYAQKMWDAPRDKHMIYY